MTYIKAIFILPILVCIAQAIAPLNDSYVSSDGKREPSSIHPFKPKTYDINMDISYEDRWRQAMKDMGHTLPELYEIFWTKVGISQDIVESLTYDMLAAYDEEYAKEVKAIADLANYPFTKVAFLNAFWDVTTECAGIIVQDKNNNVIHGRNLDFGMGINVVVSRMIFHARYLKDGKVVYEGMTKIGQIGLLTGMKDGKFSINLNQNVELGLVGNAYWEHVEEEIEGLYEDYKENYEMSLKDTTGKLKKQRMYWTPVYIARRAIEVAQSYDEMVDILKHTPTLTRAYYIVAGVEPGQGTIIQRNLNVTEDVAKLNADGDIWYLAQTNYVRNKPDDPADNRKDAACALLESVGRDQISKDTLFEVMSSYPVLNNGTIHTSIMQAKTNLLNTTIWGWSDQRVEVAVEEILES